MMRGLRQSAGAVRPRRVGQTALAPQHASFGGLRRLAWANSLTRANNRITCARALGIVLALAAPMAWTAPTRANDGADNLRIAFDQAIAEFDEAQGLLSAQPDRARRLFRSAAQRFAGIVAAGVVNGHLEYNLGNCYLQAGDIGQAVLHYRRAERLIPGDPMLADNLAVARSRCLTVIKSTRESQFLRSILFWHYETPRGRRVAVAVAGYLGFWLLASIYNFLRRRSILMAALICMGLAAASGISLAAEHWTDRNAPAGVITGVDLAVYKGPGSGYQRQFEQPLQPGVEFTLRERTRSGWWRIELVDGKTGWVDAAAAQLVPPDGL